jgi:putative tryptophan/tyrosine transport system substrate-binding protein
MTACIGRRDFITLLGGAGAWPLAARAQQGERMRRIGVLLQFSESDLAGQARIAAFGAELQKLGWSIGGNLQIDYRWAVSNEERARSAAAELLELTPDVISANSTLHLRAVQQATRTVPIVFTTIIEPVGQGFVASFRCVGPSAPIRLPTERPVRLLRGHAVCGSRNDLIAAPGRAVFYAPLAFD